MEAVLYFALWAGLFFLMMRYGCGAHVTGHRHHRYGSHGNPTRDASPGLRWVPPRSDIDPVCGMTVETAGAKSTVYDGSVYYFCSRDCRDAFEAEPAHYIGPEARSTSAHQRMEGEHG